MDETIRDPYNRIIARGYVMKLTKATSRSGNDYIRFSLLVNPRQSAYGATNFVELFEVYCVGPSYEAASLLQNMDDVVVDGRLKIAKPRNGVLTIFAESVRVLQENAKNLEDDEPEEISGGKKENDPDPDDPFADD